MKRRQRVGLGDATNKMTSGGGERGEGRRRMLTEEDVNGGESFGGGFC